jgi:nucleoside-diphosphate-sugar epimerase
MARALVTGGTGFIGRFIVEDLLRQGHEVRVSGRTQPSESFFTRPVRFIRQELDPEADFSRLFDSVDFFVHAAFDHVPGRYRGGEGDDPENFRRRNQLGSIRLFEAARQAGVRRAVFLSSRAVYGNQPSGTALDEKTPCRPDTLYGEVKLAVEEDLRRLSCPGFETVSLRITGVYGPAGKGRPHKWSGLIDDYLVGRPIMPRVGTEVHGEDVAAAITLLLNAPEWREPVLNVSDIVLDRRDLLAIVKQETGSPHPLPHRADAGVLNVMATERLRAVGWRPGGMEALWQFLHTEFRRR